MTPAELLSRGLWSRRGASERHLGGRLDGESLAGHVVGDQQWTSLGDGAQQFCDRAQFSAQGHDREAFALYANAFPDSPLVVAVPSLRRYRARAA